MKRISIVSVTVSALAVTAAFSLTSIGSTVLAQGRGTAPAYTVDPLWPQPLPNHWVFGSITGVAVDAQDHVWVVHRGADSLEANEKGMMLTPPTSSVCCMAAPFVLEFDGAGKVVSSFGGPGQGYNWPASPGSLAVDAKGNVWITAAWYRPRTRRRTRRGASRCGGSSRRARPEVLQDRSVPAADWQAGTGHRRGQPQQAGGCRR